MCECAERKMNSKAWRNGHKVIRRPLPRPNMSIFSYMQAILASHSCKPYNMACKLSVAEDVVECDRLSEILKVHVASTPVGASRFEAFGIGDISSTKLTLSQSIKETNIHTPETINCFECMDVNPNDRSLQRCSTQQVWIR